jgi:hypothetical protein
MPKIQQESISSLVERYTAAAASHGQATEAGDHKKANRAADSIAAIYRELRQRGADAQKHLLALLTHPDPGVRGWAGAHALEFAPSDGERALLQLATIRKSLVAFSAEMTLKVWREGRLRFP